MRKLLLAACLLVSSMGFSQTSSGTGVISVGAGLGIFAGGATLNQTFGSLSVPQQTGFGIGETFGVRGQYGINKMFGVGVYLRGEYMGFITNDPNITTTITNLGIGIGLEGRLYVINHKKFNLHIAPTLGFSSVHTDVSDDNTDYSGGMSGLNYGITGGFNWFFINFSKVGIGMSADIGYNACSLSGTTKDMDGILGDKKESLSYGGFYIGIGATAHFGSGKK